VDISVVICTFNRADTLAKALRTLADSTIPESLTWEILVVDNNSSDRTRKVVEEVADRFNGRCRYLFEPRSGKSYALNSGIREAQGRVIAFMDDDVVVERGWLINLTAVLCDDAGWAGVGGRTLPLETIPLPSWLAFDGRYALGGILAALFDLGDSPLQLDRAPYGANMAFRREMFEKFGGFRLDLGPSPNPEIPRPNEDTEFGRRLIAAGEKLRYEPSAVVYHPITKERIKKRYFLNWWFDYGRASVRESSRKPDPMGIPRHWMTIPKILATITLGSLFDWTFSLRPQKRFYSKCWVWMTFGQIKELMRRERSHSIAEIPSVSPVRTHRNVGTGTSLS
jgi:glycosyltransferase involved in cell wall biosynthesis